MAANGRRELTILAVSDEVDPRLYGSGSLRDRTPPDLILGCGDLPAYYLDYLASHLNAPMFAVHGNHDMPPPLEGSAAFDRCGATWLGGRGVLANGLLMAGFDGCLRYNEGNYQFTQGQMRAVVSRVVPWLLMNRLRYGRFLDVLVTHAPPRGIHDGPDLCHTGFDAFTWLIRTFRPRLHVHGHVHVHDRRATTVTRLDQTEVVNVYPFRELKFATPARS